ncbi:hypothetical protein JVT61DRAFT_5908 [Boletus reticuloceps]|uniref:Uncharacterized protein n=1 Tax=Boletus reticuloceps TaxID=495285 RepID=A0A8I2YKW5_9AGAM|nr:hypothetical protein JVT61DRAFT_5908 [Boletus reticuloceps]
MPDVNACAISRDGRWFVAAHDYQVTVWDVATRSKIREYRRSQDFRVSSGRRIQAPYFTALDISPDSSRAAIGDSIGSITLLSIPDGEQLAVCSCDRSLYLDSLRFSRAGDHLAVGTAAKITDGRVTIPSTLHIWDVSSGDRMTRYLEVPFGSFDKEVAQDERLITVDWLNRQQVLVGSHRYLLVVDATAKSTERKDMPSFQTLSNDGKFILTAATPRESSLGAYFWDPMTFTEVGFHIPHHLPLAVSPGSTLVAALPLNDDSDSSNVIFIWTLY